MFYLWNRLTNQHFFGYNIIMQNLTNERGRAMESKRIVVKVGTSTLTYPNGKLHMRRIERLARTLCELRNAGHEVVLVSSGAIRAGMGRLSISEKPREIREKQALAAVGQCELMDLYRKLFAEYGSNVAQILITKYIVDDEHGKSNVINTVNTLLDWGVIPIVNENDTISFEEIVIGDNDTLSAVVATLISADLLIILSDIDGLYEENPHENPDAALIGRVEVVNDHIREIAGGSDSGVGTGGMATKITAAEYATGNGIDMFIANGQDPAIVFDIIEHRARGTLFVGKK